MRRRLAIAALLLAGTALAREAPSWPDTFVGRLEALALMQQASLEILGDDSATHALERWCGEHKLADEARVLARVLSTDDPGAGADVRGRLEVGPDEPLRYRRVELRCGARVLSVAENWYVPARLTPAMNAELEHGDTPFGKVVRPLEPYRRTFRIEQLWSPLPEGWDRGASRGDAGADAALQIPAALVEHRALLYSSAHRPFSEVHETYQRDLLATPPAPAD